MRKVFLTLIVLILLFSCEQDPKPEIKKEPLCFKISLRPAFIEHAEIVLSNVDSNSTINLLLLANPNETLDTFYYKTFAISKSQFDKFNSEVIQKTSVMQSPQLRVIRDGMSVRFTLIHGTDTSQLYFRSPRVESDSSGYEITKTAIDNLRLILRDSVVNDYLDDIESYMDNSKEPVPATANRAINKLRKKYWQ